MQEFDDYKLPNEIAMGNMNKSYAKSKSILGSVDILKKDDKNEQNSAQNIKKELINIFDSFDWQKNLELIKQILNFTNNSRVKSYIQGLVSLNENDLQSLISFYRANDNKKDNPPFLNNLSNSFNQALKEYLKNEMQLIDNLTQFLFFEDEDERRNSIFEMIRRRLDAVRTLTNFFSNGFFL